MTTGTRKKMIALAAALATVLNAITIGLCVLFTFFTGWTNWRLALFFIVTSILQAAYFTGLLLLNEKRISNASKGI